MNTFSTIEEQQIIHSMVQPISSFTKSDDPTTNENWYHRFLDFFIQEKLSNSQKVQKGCDGHTKLLLSIIENGLNTIQNQIKQIDLDEASKSIITKCISIRQSDLKLISKIGSLQLLDFDWSLQLILGGNTLAKQQIPIIELKLICADNNGERKIIVLELDEAELKQVLEAFGTMETRIAAMDQ